jgi:hypothetical protein
MERESTYGKLKIQMFVNLNSEDLHGRQTGKWVTLLTRYGLTLEESEETAKEFMKWNPAIQLQEMSLQRPMISVQWIPRTEHIYLNCPI